MHRITSSVYSLARSHPLTLRPSILSPSALSPSVISPYARFLSTVPSLPDMSEASSKFRSHVDSLKSALSPLSASGGPPTQVFEDLPLEPYGAGSGSVPLSTVGQVVASDNKVLISCYDPSVAQVVASAIQESNKVEKLVGSVNPAVDLGKGTVAVTVPKMSRERKEGIAKLAKESGERAGKAVRGTRQELMDKCRAVLKAEGAGVGKDDVKRREKEIDKVAKDTNKELNGMVDDKVKEILG